MSIRNLADEFERVAGEPIAYAALAVYDHADLHGLNVPSADEIGKALHWDDVRRFLDYEFDSGGWDGPTVRVSAIAWSESWVIFVHEYDSSYSVHKVPCFPTDGAQVGAPQGGGW